MRWHIFITTGGGIPQNVTISKKMYLSPKKEPLFSIHSLEKSYGLLVKDSSKATLPIFFYYVLVCNHSELTNEAVWKKDDLSLHKIPSNRLKKRPPPLSSRWPLKSTPRDFIYKGVKMLNLTPLTKPPQLLAYEPPLHTCSGVPHPLGSYLGQHGISRKEG